jgi:hypothetical protein
MTSTHSHSLDGPARDLLRDVEHAHRHAGAALDDPTQDRLAAVTWGSAHLAAVTRVVHPLACRTLPDGRERVRAQAATDRRLELALWQLDRRLTGDVQLQGVGVPALVASARRALDAHAEQERALVRDLAEHLTPEQLEQLGTDLAAALLRAPTRPHPDTRHGRFIGGMAFWADGIADRVRDSLDSRTVPTPRRLPVRRPVTRWGAYALGGALPRSDRED